MEEVSFDLIYKKLQNKLEKESKQKDIEKKIVDRILEDNFENKDLKKEREKKFSDHETKMREVHYDNLTFGIYMYKSEFEEFKFDKDYKVIKEPKIVYYQASMVAFKDDKDGQYQIDNILSIRDKDKNKVQRRYDYLSKVLDTYSKQEILDLINNEVEMEN